MDAETKRLHETLAAQRVTWAKYAADHGVEGQLPYRYRVNQRCLRTIFLDFGTPREQRVQIMFTPETVSTVDGKAVSTPTIYEIDVPQASAALDPADDFTAKATAKRAKEIELEIAGRGEAGPEVQALRQQLAEQTLAAKKADERAAAQEQKLAELTALVQQLAEQQPRGKR